MNFLALSKSAGEPTPIWASSQPRLATHRQDALRDEGAGGASLMISFL